MKKALIPPMTLMTSPMSGTNMAMARVMVIQITVRTTLQRLSNEWVTIPRRRLWTRSIRLRMTDLRDNTLKHINSQIIQNSSTQVSLTSQGEEWWDRWWWLIFQKVVWRWSWPRHFLDMTSRYLRRPLVQTSWSRTHLEMERVAMISAFRWYWSEVYISEENSPVRV